MWNSLQRILTKKLNFHSFNVKGFLEANLAKGKNKTKSPLGVIEPTLATAIQENLSIPCRSDETVRELIRGIRFHFTKFVKPLQGGNLEQSQLGLGHSYSRSKVPYSSCDAPFTCERLRVCDGLIFVMTIFWLKTGDSKRVVADPYFYTWTKRSPHAFPASPIHPPLPWPPLTTNQPSPRLSVSGQV